MMKSCLKLFIILFYPLYLGGVDIAVTIDDYPMEDGVIFSAQKRTKAFIEACERHSCKAAFFCVGKNCMRKDGASLLSQLDKKKHFLCNHSMNHLHLSSQNLEDFEREVKEVDRILALYANMKKWYRYPFLDYGNRIPLGGSYSKTSQSLQILDELGYKEGYVSINTFDWHINRRLSDAIKSGCSVDYESLKSLYLRLLKSWCEHYINFYEREFSEKITHTLLLHANDLNALFLEEILDMICESGWNIVSPEIAFSDVSWRKKILQSPEIILKKPPYLDCSEIDQLLLEEKIFTK